MNQEQIKALRQKLANLRAEKEQLRKDKINYQEILESTNLRLDEIQVEITSLKEGIE